MVTNTGAVPLLAATSPASAQQPALLPPAVSLARCPNGHVTPRTVASVPNKKKQNNVLPKFERRVSQFMHVLVNVSSLNLSSLGPASFKLGFKLLVIHGGFLGYALLHCC